MPLSEEYEFTYQSKDPKILSKSKKIITYFKEKLRFDFCWGELVFNANNKLF